MVLSAVSRSESGSSSHLVPSKPSADKPIFYTGSRQTGILGASAARMLVARGGAAPMVLSAVSRSESGSSSHLVPAKPSDAKSIFFNGSRQTGILGAAAARMLVGTPVSLDKPAVGGRPS